MIRIYEFNTQNVSNYLTQKEDRELHSSLFHVVREPGDTKLKYAKRRLGPQDYTWVGSVRHWVWEREFDVPEINVHPSLRWRAFVSKRGLALEVEDRFGQPEGKTIRVAARAALRAFAALWLGEREQKSPRVLSRVVPS